MKITDLKPNEVIHCKTHEEAVRICGMMHAAGFRPGSFFTDNWDVHEENTCYDLRSDEAGHVALYVQDNYTIHPSELFQDSDSSDEITEDGLLARGLKRTDWECDGEKFHEWKLMTPSEYRIEVNENFSVEIVTLGVATSLPAVKTLADIDHLIRLLGV